MPLGDTVSVALPADAADVLRESVEAGEYASLDEAMHDAVRLWQGRRSEDAARIEAMKARIKRSLDDPRPNLTSEEVDERLEAMFAEATRNFRGGA